MTTISKTHKTLADLLEYHGEKTPARLGRSLYKYVGCGPWTTFVVETKPAGVRHCRAVLRLVDGVWHLHRIERGGPDFGQFLGYAPGGLPKDMHRKHHYLGLLRDFQRKEGTKRRLHFMRLGDKLLVETTEKTLPWYKDIYYESKQAGAIWHTWKAKCTGIKIGSIVEGSDVEISPVTLDFPFTEQDYEDAINGIDEEAKFYWLRDNSQWLTVKVRSRRYFLRNTWGDIVWTEKPSPKIVKAVEALVKGADKIPAEDEGGLAVPGTRAVVWEYDNDATY